MTTDKTDKKATENLKIKEEAVIPEVKEKETNSLPQEEKSAEGYPIVEFEGKKYILKAEEIATNTGPRKVAKSPDIMRRLRDKKSLLFVEIS